MALHPERGLLHTKVSVALSHVAINNMLLHVVIFVFVLMIDIPITYSLPSGKISNARGFSSSNW